MDKKPAIVFCDTGVDDAIMLMQLFAPASRVNVAAVVAGAGNVPPALTARNSHDIALLCGAGDVPVYQGVENRAYGDGAMGAEGLGRVKIHGNAPRAFEAFRPEQLVPVLEAAGTQGLQMVSSGSLTDVRDMLVYLETQRPDLLPAIASIVMMGGVVDPSQANAPVGVDGVQSYSEFNIYMDPDASRDVFALTQKHKLPVMLAPLDLTHQLPVSFPEVDALLKAGNPVAATAAALWSSVPIWDLYRYPPEKNGGFASFPSHDPTLAVYVNNPELFDVRPASLQVEGMDGAKPGRMYDAGAESNVQLLSLKAEKHAAYRQQMVQDLASYGPFETPVTVTYTGETQPAVAYRDSLLQALGVDESARGEKISLVA